MCVLVWQRLPWEGEPRGVGAFIESSFWKGEPRGADGQWPPLRVQPCRFRQKRRISTSSAQCAHWAPSPPGEGLSMRSSSSYYGFLTVSSPGRHDCRDLILFYEHLPFGMDVILLRCKHYYSLRSPTLTQPRRRQVRSISGVRTAGRAMATRARSSQSMPQR